MYYVPNSQHARAATRTAVLPSGSTAFPGASPATREAVRRVRAAAKPLFAGASRAAASAARGYGGLAAGLAAWEAITAAEEWFEDNRENGGVLPFPTPEEWVEDGAWNPPGKVLNPGLNYWGRVPGTSGTINNSYGQNGPFVTSTRNPIGAASQRGTSVNYIPPDVYAWRNPIVPLDVPAGYWVGMPIKPTRRARSSLYTTWSRTIDWYQNGGAGTVPAEVESPPFAPPIGPVAPPVSGRPSMHRVDWHKVQGGNRPIPGFVDTIQIDMTSDRIRLIPNPVERPPREKEREKKMRGKGPLGRILPTAVFWLWESVQDWRDWLKIMLAAMDLPADVRKMSLMNQLLWLMDNPSYFATINDYAVVIGLFQWAIDEKFGAELGRMTQKGSLGATKAGGTERVVDIKFGVNNVAPSFGTSPGAVIAGYVDDWLNS